MERAGEKLRFRPGDDVADLCGGRWELEGATGVLEATVAAGRLQQRAPTLTRWPESGRR